MIPYGRQSIDKNDIRAVLDVLKSDWLTQGPKVKEFEAALCKYTGVRYAVAVSNGTAALHMAYLAAGLKKGDEAVTTPNTFAATSNMVLAVGAKPVFCDIRLDSYNIDEQKISKAVTKNTKIIVPVHFAGQACDMEAIYKLAKKKKLAVIEDACHALGAKYKNNKIGSCKFSDMAVFSFHPVKNITTGEGGAVLANSKKLYKKLISLRSHGIYKDARGKNVMVELGYNYRITDFQCALGLSQLKKLDQMVRQRRKAAEWYKNELEGIKDILLPKEQSGNYSAWHIYVIRVANARLRDKLSAYLKEKGIGANFHYPAVYSHPYYRKNGYKEVNLKNEKVYEKSCITLPLYPALNWEEVKYICRTIKKYFHE